MSSDSNGINFITSGTGNGVQPVPQTPSNKRARALSEDQEKNNNNNGSENVFTTLENIANTIPKRPPNSDPKMTTN